MGRRQALGPPGRGGEFSLCLIFCVQTQRRTVCLPLCISTERAYLILHAPFIVYLLVCAPPLLPEGI